MALTGRAGVLALGAAVLVAVAAPQLLGVLVATALLAVLVGVDVALAVRMRDLRVTRTGDSTVRLGGTAHVELQVEVRGRRRLRGRLRDAWSPSAGAEPTSHELDVAPGGRGRVTTTLRPSRRGDRRSGPVTIRAVGPLGVAARQGSHVMPWCVRVLPPFSSRRHLPSALSRLRELDGRAAIRTRGQGTEFDALRDYVVGDDTRAIDWRATARRGEVVVRTWRPERDRRIGIVLDTSRTSAGRVGNAPRLEAAMDAALLLAAVAAHAGDRVDLLAFDRVPRARVTGMSGSRLLPALVDALATVEPVLVEADMPSLLGTVLAQSRQRSLVVLFTGLDAAVVTEGLLPALGPLLHRHRLLVAAVADPLVAAMALERGTATAVYRAAAASRALGERAHVVSLLERRGVAVVDALPAMLAPAVTDRYLSLKAAGRL